MVMKKRWKIDKEVIASAVDAAEDSSGHQIMVHLGDLSRNSSRRADSIATRNPGISLLLCVDLAHHRYEVRWARGLTLDGDRVHDAIVSHLAHGDVANAITSLAALLPRQDSGVELPDVVDDSKD